MDAYQRYGRALLRKASRMLGNPDDAHDIVQGLFVDLLQKSDVPLDLPYLYRAVSNRCLTFLRDEANRARLLRTHDGAVRPVPRSRCDERVIGHDLLAKLVRELDPTDCEILAFHYLDDMTQDEIAVLVGFSRRTIGKRIDRIRAAVARVSGRVDADRGDMT
jgi:RNA polymerase sigma factor (sigma-70 family)